MSMTEGVCASRCPQRGEARDSGIEHRAFDQPFDRAGTKLGVVPLHGEPIQGVGCGLELNARLLRAAL